MYFVKTKIVTYMFVYVFKRINMERKKKKKKKTIEARALKLDEKIGSVE